MKNSFKKFQKNTDIASSLTNNEFTVLANLNMKERHQVLTDFFENPQNATQIYTMDKDKRKELSSYIPQSMIDKKFLKQYSGIYPNLLSNANDEIQNDIEFIKGLIKRYPKTAKNLSIEQWKNDEISRTFLNKNFYSELITSIPTELFNTENDFRKNYIEIAKEKSPTFNHLKFYATDKTLIETNIDRFPELIIYMPQKLKTESFLTKLLEKNKNVAQYLSDEFWSENKNILKYIKDNIKHCETLEEINNLIHPIKNIINKKIRENDISFCKELINQGFIEYFPQMNNEIRNNQEMKKIITNKIKEIIPCSEDLNITENMSYKKITDIISRTTTKELREGLLNLIKESQLEENIQIEQ